MSYHTERYNIARDVLVRFDDGDVIIDAIKGMNVGHALYRARVCWDGAEVMDLGPADETLTFDDAMSLAKELVA